MRSPLPLFVFVLVLPLATQACRSSDDDDDNLVPDIFELGGEDVTVVESDLATTSDVTRVLQELIAFDGSGNSIDPRDPCIRVDEDRDGADFRVLGTFENCAIETQRFGTGFADGIFDIEGSLQPSEETLGRHEASASQWIDHLSTLTRGAGPLQSFAQYASNYELNDANGFPLLDVLESRADIVEYETLSVSVFDYQVPRLGESGLPLRVSVQGGIAFSSPQNLEDSSDRRNRDVTSGDAAPPKLIGRMTASFFRDLTGEDREVSFRIRLAFDGTDLAAFVIDENGQSGTIDLQTGEVTISG